MARFAKLYLRAPIHVLSTTTQGTARHIAIIAAAKGLPSFKCGMRILWLAIAKHHTAGTSTIRLLPSPKHPKSLFKRIIWQILL